MRPHARGWNVLHARHDDSKRALVILSAAKDLKIRTLRD